MASTVTTGPYATKGYVLIEGSGGAVGTTWTVRRKHPDDAAFSDIATYTGASFSHRDYLAPSNYAAVYRVTQTDGVTVVNADYDVWPRSDQYWLIHPTNEALSFPLGHVTADAFDDEYEETVHNVIGRGRKSDIGDNWGAVGQLSAEIRDTEKHTAAEQRRMLQTIRAERSYVYLRNPFGDVWKVSLGRIPFERVGGIGLREYLQVTIPYTEVR